VTTAAVPQANASFSGRLARRPGHSSIEYGPLLDFFVFTERHEQRQLEHRVTGDAGQDRAELRGDSTGRPPAPS